VVRAVDDTLLTGMLAWSGSFGLIAGSYFVGRSDALKLAALLPAWSLALSLLTVSVMRDPTWLRKRFPAPAELAVLFAWGLTACSLAQLHAPWREVDRLRRGGAPAIYGQPMTRRFVDAHTRPGERVAIVAPLAHRLAYDIGIVNVSPYGPMEAIVTRAQFIRVLEAMRAEHAHKLFAADSFVAPAHVALLQEQGFGMYRSGGGVSYWSDVPAADG
jgi:hypothetical protein